MRSEERLDVVEIAPGIDLKKDVLAQAAITGTYTLNPRLGA